MFIETETTPNPATLKFLPGQAVMEKGTADFPSPEKAARSPLAKGLFAIEGVISVFFGADFISVSKHDGKDWTTLKPQILGAIMEHYTSGRPLLEGPDASESDGLDEDGVVMKIKELLDTRIRPAVAQDGGDIIFRGFEDGTVFLHMQGACSGCPSSSATLKHGIENMLRYYVPEVQAVQAVD
jgi:Fe-S cluster biogenesis protein NfuA